MIDFPANPSNGQQYTSAGVTWTYDGTKWTASGLGVAYLPLAGGTMLGPIVLAADPTAPMQAATARSVIGDNRIINGDMRIDQRNAGASGTANGYTVDRWQFFGPTVKGSWMRQSTFPTFPFPYCLNFTTSSAYTPIGSDHFVFYQSIEADMVSDFMWGSSNAQTVTLSFWVDSSLTGTFSGAILNYAQTRSYPFSFSIPVAGVFTKIVVTIPGDTAGTWVMSGNVGSIFLMFDLGSGPSVRGPANAWASAGYNGVTGSVSIVSTNGATFYVTGVKLETGSVATPYPRQSLTKSLADCQRYFQKLGGTAASFGAQGYSTVAGQWSHTVDYAAMRAAPTAAIVGNWTNTNVSSVNFFPGLQTMLLQANTLASTAFGWYPADATGVITLSAEL